MSCMMATVGRPGEVISLISHLWNIECRRQLGEISRAEYLRAVRTARRSFENGDAMVKPMELIDER